MPTISFNAFSFLQKKLKTQNRPYSNASVEIADGDTVADLIQFVGLGQNDVEAVFVNGLVQPIDTLLQEGDRVAMVPPGTPGPYRVLLGIRKRGKPRSD